MRYYCDRDRQQRPATAARVARTVPPSRVLPLACALLLAFAILVIAGFAPPRAFAFSDVSKKYWDYNAITAVTKLGPAHQPAVRALVDYGLDFKPGSSCTRAQLAKALVLAAGQQNLVVIPVPLSDVPVDDPNYLYIQIALKLKLVYMEPDGFHPDDGVREWEADRSLVRFVKLQASGFDWSMLSSLRSDQWEPNPDWKTGAPAYLQWEVAARALGLRFNHLSSDDGQEVLPKEVIDRAEVAYMIDAAQYALKHDTWLISQLSEYDNVVLPPLSDRQKQIVKFALQYVGYPYIWGGEYPTPQGNLAPYGPQAQGGFDCSGFVWWVMKIHFGYPIYGRGAHDIAAESKSRIKLAKLVAGDVIFFAPDGPKSKVDTIYHTGIALGNGWFVHSTGSSDGVTIAYLGTPKQLTYWGDDFAWGRRLLSKAELQLTPPTTPPSPQP